MTIIIPLLAVFLMGFGARIATDHQEKKCAEKMQQTKTGNEAENKEVLACKN